MEEIMRTAILAARAHVAGLLAAQNSLPGSKGWVPDTELLTAQTALRQMEQTYEQQFGALVLPASGD